MLFTGIFVGLVAGLAFFLSIHAIDGSKRHAPDDAEASAEIAARVAPVGRIAMLGDAEIAARNAAATARPARVEAPLSGTQVYNAACYQCHAAPGVGGAPVIGDAAAWSGRAAAGLSVLTQRAIDGFQGQFGVMPAKGGRLDLSDEEIISAVEYMLEQISE